MFKRSMPNNLKAMFPKAVSILLILTVLVTIGTAYANISGGLVTNSTVAGVLDPSFSGVQSNDNGSTGGLSGYATVDPGDTGNDPSATQTPGVSCARQSVNVASTSASLNADPKKIDVTISNAYPGYYATVFFEINNAESQTGRVTSVSATTSDSSAITATVDLITVDNLISGSGGKKVGSLQIHATNPLPGQTYTISATIVVRQDTFTITPSAGAGGSISPSTVQTVNYGANQTFNISANSGYHISDVLVDSGSVGAVSSYTFNNVQADHTISASFAPDIVYYTLTTAVSPSGAGSVSGSGSYAAGTVVTVSASANSGYTFSSWSGNLSGSTNPTTITMNGNKSVTANFSGTNISMLLEKDTYVSSYTTAEKDTNYGNSATLNITKNGNDHRMILAGFDLSPLAGKIIDSATLRVYYVSGDISQPIEAHVLLLPWVEGNGSTTGATWNKPDKSQAATWDLKNSAGGAYLNASVSANTTTGWTSWNITGDVQSFVSGTPNYGWILMYGTANNKADTFYSKEAAQGQYIPQLLVTFH